MRGNRWPWPDMAFHVSWWTESGWRATELRRHEIRDYEADRDTAERTMKELGVELRITPAQFVFLRKRR